MRHSLLAIVLIGALAALAMPGMATAQPNSQQQRMKECNAAAAGMRGADRERFMSSCLSNKPAEAQKPHCVKGKPCGNSCIAMDKICRK